MPAIVHPDYSTATNDNDIALLKLAQAVDLGTHTPACLPDTAADYVGKVAKVYGELKLLDLTLSTSHHLTLPQLTSPPPRMGQDGPLWLHRLR